MSDARSLVPGDVAFWLNRATECSLARRRAEEMARPEHQRIWMLVQAIDEEMVKRRRVLAVAPLPECPYPGCACGRYKPPPPPDAPQ